VDGVFISPQRMMENSGFWDRPYLISELMHINLLLEKMPVSVNYYKKTSDKKPKGDMLYIR
jgi:hypothetical protein